MIDDSRVNSTRPPLRDAVHETLDRAELLDALADRPERLEAGLTILARDVEGSGAAVIPLLATDADGHLTAVWAADEPVGGATLADALATARRLLESLPMLRKILASAARSSIPPLETDRVRLVYVAPSFRDEARQLATIVSSPSVEFVHACVLRVGDTRALCLEPAREGSHAGDGSDADRIAPSGRDSRDESSPRATSDAEASNGGSDSRAHRRRLLADARTRILNLSPEISALEARGGLVFRYRGRELASFTNEGDGLRLLSPRLPDGRRILGRSDLEDGLHAVIEEFFALYAIQPKRGQPSAAETTATDPAADRDPAPKSDADAQRDDTPTDDAPRTAVPPLSGLRTAPLSREEIEEFLRHEDDES